MKAKLPILPLLALAGWLVGSLNTHAEEGYTPLFNGKNFDGWYLKVKEPEVAEAGKVFGIDEESGCVHVMKDLPDQFALGDKRNPAHGCMYTNKKYSRFSLKWEYKWGKKIENNFGSYQYDAGVYYHVVDDKIWPIGIEYQVRYNHLLDHNHTGDFCGSSTACQWYCDDKNQFQMPSEGGQPKLVGNGMHFASPKAVFHGLDDQWNQCEIIVMGNQFAIHKLNGMIVNMGTNLAQSQGIIGFQSECAEIFYRNIRIKEFTEDIPAEKFY